MNREKSMRGFTITEILTASFILIVVLAMVSSTYIFLSQYVTDVARQATMQRQIRLAIDKMARDIRKASSIDCPPSGNTISLLFDPGKLGETGSLWTSRYRLVGNQILFSPDMGLPQENLIIDNVALAAGDKLFQYDGGRKLVTIDLRTENLSPDSSQDAQLTTIVKVRNAY